MAGGNVGQQYAYFDPKRFNSSTSAFYFILFTSSSQENYEIYSD